MRFRGHVKVHFHRAWKKEEKVEKKKKKKKKKKKEEKEEEEKRTQGRMRVATTTRKGIK